VNCASYNCLAIPSFASPYNYMLILFCAGVEEWPSSMKLSYSTSLYKLSTQILKYLVNNGKNLSPVFQFSPVIVYNHKVTPFNDLSYVSLILPDV